MTTLGSASGGHADADSSTATPSIPNTVVVKPLTPVASGKEILPAGTKVGSKAESVSTATTSASSSSSTKKAPSASTTGTKVGTKAQSVSTATTSASSSSSTKKTPSSASTRGSDGVGAKAQLVADSKGTKFLDSSPLPLPRKPSRCPLVCCFFAEFDNIVGPVVSYDCPKQFMDQPINVSPKDMNRILADTFQHLKADAYSSHPQETEPESDSSLTMQPHDDDLDGDDQQNGDDQQSQAYNRNLPKTPSHLDSKRKDRSSTEQRSPRSPSHQQQEWSTDNTATTPTANNSNNSSEMSIFESTSEFIITGQELTGNIVNLSAYNIHITTRPTIIVNERYERNSLLFSVGFVLRRNEDPRPFRPVLSKLALTLQQMEMDSQFCSNPATKPQIQPILERVLLSLNSNNWEANLVLPGNLLNLKLFHPPKVPNVPVPDHAVPILLRPEFQVQLYDWDYAINWVCQHIDGIRTARQLSDKIEVDMEILRDCLRVLKHHRVISLVDMFFYSNRYEATPKAAMLLSGKEYSRLMQEAADFVIKGVRRPAKRASTLHNHHGNNHNSTSSASLHGLGPVSTSSPSASPKMYGHTPTVTTATATASPPPATVIPPSIVSDTLLMLEGARGSVDSASSHLSSTKGFSISSSFLQDGHPTSTTTPSATIFGRDDLKEFKAILVELYCAFNRNKSFGDLLLAVVTKQQQKEKEKEKQQQKQQQKRQQVQRTTTMGSLSSSPLWAGFTKKGKKQQRILSYRRSNSGSSQTEDANDNALSSSPSESRFEAARAKEATTASKLDVRDVLEMFDHRRFIAFGIVHGLLVRVHNYPFATKLPNVDPTTSAQPRNYAGILQDTGIPHDLTQRVASMMDGTHCDDEIVSIFERPIEELIELVETVELKKVLPLYAVASKS